MNARPDPRFSYESSTRVGDIPAQLVQDFDIDPKEVDMLYVDMPVADAAMVIQVKQPTRASAGEFAMTLGACELVPNIKRMRPEFEKRGDYALNPHLTADAHFFFKNSRRIELALDTADVKVIGLPKHGRLSEAWSNGSVDQLYSYLPEKGFVGNDRVEFALTNKDGLKVKLIYFIKVDPKFDTYTYPDVDMYPKYCGKRITWKISQSDFDSGSQDYAAWVQSAQLSTLIATASQSLTGFQDLAGSAVGNTVGEGPTAQITLDTTAAGHNWYIDPTPQDNTDDYLPTSNPNIWQAKAGTDAAGKMDMLSVLLHEYGHALGLEHSAQVGDFMSATLQPGERRLPNADELALMSKLVAQIKASQADAAAQSNALADPSAPAGPGNPLSMLGLLPLGFVRRNGAATGTVHTDYLTAIQPTLTNGSFATGLAQWESTGAVSAAGADAAHYTVTLSESSPTSAGQTHVGQAFVLGATDRFQIGRASCRERV